MYVHLKREEIDFAIKSVTKHFKEVDRNERTKFRIWIKDDEEKLCCFYNTGLLPNGDIIIYSKEFNETIKDYDKEKYTAIILKDFLKSEILVVPNEEVIIEQSTRVLDSKGQLIYEGDILETEQNDLYEIRYKDGKYIAIYYKYWEYIDSFKDIAARGTVLCHKSDKDLINKKMVLNEIENLQCQLTSCKKDFNHYRRKAKKIRKDIKRLQEYGNV